MLYHFPLELWSANFFNSPVSLWDGNSSQEQRDKSDTDQLSFTNSAGHSTLVKESLNPIRASLVLRGELEVLIVSKASADFLSCGQFAPTIAGMTRREGFFQAWP